MNQAAEEVLLAKLVLVLVFAALTLTKEN